MMNSVSQISIKTKKKRSKKLFIIFQIKSFNRFSKESLTEEEELAIDNQQNLRILKWTEMLDNFDVYKTIKFSKLKERTRKGIPEAMRGLAWINIADIKNFKKGKENLYTQ